MASHRRSLSGSSSEALYLPIPVAPVAANPAPRRLSVELNGEHDVGVDEPPLAAATDARIRWIHVVLGAAVLLPWNAMITATPYFISRLAGSSLGSTFSSYLSISFTLANFGFLIHATATSKQSNPTSRVLGGILTLASLIFLLALSTYISNPQPALFFSLVLINAVAQAGAGSYLQTSIVKVASIFGPGAMMAMMAGQAAVGVAVSVVQVVGAVASVKAEERARAALNESEVASSVSRSRAFFARADDLPSSGKAEEKSAFAFFGLSTLFLLVSAGAYVWMTRLPAYRAVIVSGPPRRHGKRFSASSDTLDYTPLSASSSSVLSATGEEVGLEEEGDADDRHRLLGGSGGRSEPMKVDERQRIWTVAKANVVYEVTVAYVFIVTLALFPPLTLSILPTNPTFHPLLFSSIHFLLYNVGDFIGRYLCSFPRLLIWSARKLLALSLTRTLFVPLFLMCNVVVQRPSPPPGFPSLESTMTANAPIINSDMIFFLLLLLFGMSNGYVCSMAMMSAASLEHNPRLRKLGKENVDTAATVASFCLVGGLVMGSAASFGVRWSVCGGCNPFKG